MKEYFVKMRVSPLVNFGWVFVGELHAKVFADNLEDAGMLPWMQRPPCSI